MYRTIRLRERDRAGSEAPERRNVMRVECDGAGKPAGTWVGRLDENLVREIKVADGGSDAELP